MVRLIPASSIKYHGRRLEGACSKAALRKSASPPRPRLALLSPRWKAMPHPGRRSSRSSRRRGAGGYRGPSCVCDRVADQRPEDALFDLEEAFCLEPIKVGDSVVLALPDELSGEDQEALAKALRDWHRAKRGLDEGDMQRGEYVAWKDSFKA